MFILNSLITPVITAAPQQPQQRQGVPIQAAPIQAAPIQARPDSQLDSLLKTTRHIGKYVVVAGCASQVANAVFWGMDGPLGPVSSALLYAGSCSYLIELPIHLGRRMQSCFEKQKQA